MDSNGANPKLLPEVSLSVNRFGDIQDLELALYSFFVPFYLLILVRSKCDNMYLKEERKGWQRKPTVSNVQMDLQPVMT